MKKHLEFGFLVSLLGILKTHATGYKNLNIENFWLTDIFSLFTMTLFCAIASIMFDNWMKENNLTKGGIHE